MREGWYLEKIMDDVSLLIHGPLKEDTYKFYCRFYPEVPKIFSTWEGNEKSNDWRYRADLHSSKDVYIKNKSPNRIGCWERRMELDVVSVLSGLEKVRTGLVIKLRGDEWYSNLHHVYEAMEKDNEKMLMLPVFLKKWEVWPFRISDHLLAGRKSNLELMYETCLINIALGRELDHYCWPLPRQSILAMGYVKKKMRGDMDAKESLKALFGIVDLNKLKYYKVSSENGTESWYSNFKPFIENLETI